MEINLSADAQAPQVAGFDPANSRSFNYSTTQTAYDGSGEPAVLRHYFAKDSTDPDTWWMYTSVLNNDGNEVFTNESGGVILPNLAFSFDPSGSGINGLDTNVSLVGGVPTATLNPPSTLSGVGTITVPAFESRSEFQFSFELSKMTQFAGRNSVNALSQNGYPKGDFPASTLTPVAAFWFATQTDKRFQRDKFSWPDSSTLRAFSPSEATSGPRRPSLGNLSKVCLVKTEWVCFRAAHLKNPTST